MEDPVIDEFAPGQNPRVRAATSELLRAAELVAGGTAVGYALVMVAEDGVIYKSMMTLNGEHLLDIAKACVEQSSGAYRLGSLWEGNVGTEARSLTVQ